MKSSTIDHSSHLESLTWLRGIAALFVVISHTLRATEVRYHPLDQIISLNPLAVFDLGTFGVLLFFTLSGTTLYISNAKAGRRFYAGSFYIKRVFRIWPAYLVSVILYLMFSPLFAEIYPAPMGLWIEKQFLADVSLNQMLSYLSLSFNITGPSGLINNAYWSLPVEFQYYLIFPLILLAIRFIGLAAPLTFASILYFVFRFDWHFFYDSKVFMLAFTFCFGVAIGHLYSSKLITFRLNRYLGSAVLLLTLLLSSLISNRWVILPDFPVISNLWICIGLLASLSVLIVLYSDICIPPWLKSKLMHYGEISYSVYLYHNLLIAAAVSAMILFGVHNALARLGIVAFASVILTYGVALLSFNYIEKVFINYGRILSEKFK